MFKDDKTQKYIINPLMWFFVNYILFILANDYLTYFFKLSKNITYTIAFILITFINYFNRKKIQFKKIDFSKYDIFYILILIILFLIRIVIPDSSYDVLNYHLYLQENPFADNITFNFFPARWINTYSLPLADRMIYFFRYILNYRLGVIFNLLILILIYYQMKRLIKHFNISKKTEILTFLSFFSIVTEQILCNAVTYYTDIICIPIFIELLIICITNKKEPNHYYTLLLAGILFSLKVSNAFFILIFAIFYIIKYRKTINLKIILIGAIVFIFPFILYLINNYIQTGNPFFPFYNSIFKSKYLESINWIEEFYGPKSLYELIIWPIYIIFNPRRAYDTNVYYGRISFSYMSCLIMLVLFTIEMIKERKNIKKYISNNINSLIINVIFFILCIIWGKFMMGYIRYALILEVIGWIIIILLTKKMLLYKKIISNIVIIIIMICCSFQITYSLKDAFYDSTELSWRYPVTNKNGLEKYKNNIKSLFKKNKKQDEKLKSVDCIGIVDYNSGYASMITSKIPIISLNESYNNKYGLKEYEKFINNCENIYTITTKFTKDRTHSYLNNIFYEYTDNIIEIDTDFLDEENELYLIEINKKMKGK